MAPNFDPGITDLATSGVWNIKVAPAYGCCEISLNHGGLRPCEVDGRLLLRTAGHRGSREAESHQHRCCGRIQRTAQSAASTRIRQIDYPAGWASRHRI